MKKTKNKSKNKQKSLCIRPTQCSEKDFMKVSAVHVKVLKTLKYLPKFFSRRELWIYVYCPVSKFIYFFFFEVDEQVL